MNATVNRTMTEESLRLLLQQMLIEFGERQRAFAAEHARYRQLARMQNRRLAVGRLKIDAMRAALEARSFDKRGDLT